MIKSLVNCLPSDLPSHVRVRLQAVVDIWDGFEQCAADAEGTQGSVLEGLRAEVQDTLSRNPIDLNRVQSLTAEAVLWTTGRRSF